MRQTLLPFFEDAEVARIEAKAIERVERRISRHTEKRLVYWVAQIHQVLHDTLDDVTQKVNRLEHAFQRLTEAYGRDQDDADWWKRGPREDDGPDK